MVSVNDDRVRLAKHVNPHASNGVAAEPLLRRVHQILFLIALLRAVGLGFLAQPLRLFQTNS
jgi:hypothetical protein